MIRGHSRLHRERGVVPTSSVYRRARHTGQRRVPAQAGLGDFYNNVVKVVKGDKEATFAPLDRDSEGGLGQTSEDVFGPLVRHFIVLRAVHSFP